MRCVPKRLRRPVPSDSSCCVNAERRNKRVVALHDRVAARPRVAAYLASERRIPFSEADIFRRYRELDRA